MEPIEIRLLYWASSAWDSDAELLEEASRTITELREKLDITTTALKKSLRQIGQKANVGKWQLRQFCN